MHVQQRRLKESLIDMTRSDKIEWNKLTEIKLADCGLVFLDPMVNLRMDNLRKLDLSGNDIWSV